MIKPNTNESIDVMIYNDGRAHVTTPKKPTFTQLALFEMFKKGTVEGEIRNMPAGSYIFKFKTVSLIRGAEAELLLKETDV